jgi:hypothetical protein
MKIEGLSKVAVNNYVLSGYYSAGFNRGIRPKLFEFSSPTYGIEKFQPPYDAILNYNSSLTGVARSVKSLSEISSNRSGKLYFYDKADLFGMCHGFGRDSLTFYKGLNFYQAFYPGGYFSPPYGETSSLFLTNSNGTDNLKNGSCSNLSYSEYNEQMGILSKGASDVGIMTDSLVPSTYSPIFSPRGVCPSDAAVTFFYEEAQQKQIQGTSTAIGAGTFYNGNPIPTMLDGYRIVIPNGRYIITGAGDNRYIQFIGGKPIPSYSFNSQTTDLNNNLCPATLLETNVNAGKGTNSIQLIEAPDILHGSPQDQIFISQGLDTHFYFWHFLFKENADTLPFSNGAISIDTSKTISNRSISQDTMLFEPVLASEDYYWQNRQCPDAVDFLPWTVGASIYACPSNHFDIPYYAAIKKFGFYGTRFLNTCNALDLSNTWSGVENAMEIPSSETSVPIPKGDIEPEDIDVGGNFSFGAYDNLLKTAKAEEQYSNMYALNKGFFLWANALWITGNDNFTQLSSFEGFSNAYFNLYNKFQHFFTGGLSSFISGEPSIIMRGGLASSSYASDNSTMSDLLFTTEAYRKFYSAVQESIPSLKMPLWNDLENKYGYYVTDEAGINESFYSGIISGREKRILTRYMENSVRGNPIDLFPLNHIYFSFDSSKDYLEHTGWARGISMLSSSNIPSVNRRYFEGAYGNASEITGLTQVLDKISFLDTTAFYPGFFNSYLFNKDLPTPSYIPVISGIIMDEKKRKFIPSGWLALGYNEIGALDSNFSCFTPLFIQQPLPKVFTKIGQSPTFRALAVDYHTIPDDKLSARYPEIIYWAYKLKIIGKNFKNRYPLKYKWLRVQKNKYTNFLAKGDMSEGDYSNPTGEWSCLEDDGPNCTVIHPKECFPTGINDSYTFKKGAIQGKDDNYYYMCLVSGRFGIRISEKSELKIEDWLRFDISFKNGLNSTSPVSLSFVVTDTGNKENIVSFESKNISAYCGYQQDITAIPESVIEQKVPPPNAGFGDVTAFRFVGPALYVGSTRSYQPDTLMDTRGTRGAWGRMIDYGALIEFSKSLNQAEGDLLYGYSHLPVCENYHMPAGKQGIKVVAKIGDAFVSHWSLSQQAVAAMDTSVGMPWDKSDNLGSLYPPITKPMLNLDKNGKINWSIPGGDALNGGYGIGHWQWGNNLGSIKRFGKISTPETNDIVFLGRNAPRGNDIDQGIIDKVKDAMLQPDSLAGTNCGFSNLGLGRHMVYYIEAYGRFYILCDLLKKKNVKNLSFMCPGTRSTNSAIQYFWMGHPSNTYVERRPMYGPYAYQWRVNRHNRDRNGNGISEGFYSMGWGKRYSLMYDAPAIYGLYVKRNSSADYKGKVQQVLDAQSKVFPNGIADFNDFRGSWFGVGGSEGSSRTYGSYFCSSFQSSNLCDYIAKAQELASFPDFKAYECSASQLANGQCFDPCLSMRYGQGFFPGGKSQNLFGFNAENHNSNPKNIRLVPTATIYSNGEIKDGDEQSVNDPSIFFRSPINTPHARISRSINGVGSINRNQEFIIGVSPCNDGGSDHCNFITPTIHLKTSCMLLTNASSFIVAKNYAANLLESINIRGDLS